MPISKATASSIAPAAKGDLVVGSATNDAAVLGVGANGTVLTAASGEATGLQWATPSSGGMTLLSTTTLSGATTTISSISGAYTDLYVLIYGMTGGNSDSKFRIAPNASTNITSQIGQQTSTTLTNTFGDYLYLSSITGSNDYVPVIDNASNIWALTINNYSSTASRKAFSVTGGFHNQGWVSFGAFWANGGINTTSAISSLVFSRSAGNLSAGTVLVYGVK
jgi:hypothetical protein